MSIYTEEAERRSKEVVTECLCWTCGAIVKIPEVPVRNTGFLTCPQGRNHLVPYTKRAIDACKAAGHDVRPVNVKR